MSRLKQASPILKWSPREKAFGADRARGSAAELSMASGAGEAWCEMGINQTGTMLLVTANLGTRSQGHLGAFWKASIKRISPFVTPGRCLLHQEHSAISKPKLAANSLSCTLYPFTNEDKLAARSDILFQYCSTCQLTPATPTPLPKKFTAKLRLRVNYKPFTFSNTKQGPQTLGEALLLWLEALFASTAS